MVDCSGDALSAERRVYFLNGARSGIRDRRLLENAKDLRARVVQGGAGVHEHLRRDSFLLANQAEQQVLGADVGVIELARLGHGELEHLLRARRIRQVGSRDLVEDAAASLPRRPRRAAVQVDAEVLEHRRRDAFALADNAEQHVLGPDVLVVKRAASSRASASTCRTRSVKL